MKRCNIGLVAHVDAGKTTLTEQMLYLSGAVKRLGSVDAGTAQTDYMEVERRRGISVKSACAVLRWGEGELNLIDTPGHADFAAEVERSLRVLDCAVLVLSCVEGVQAQSEVYYDALRRLRIPTLLFLNKADRPGADPQDVLRQVRERLKVRPLPVPGRDRWLELLAEEDEGLLERYLGDRPVSEEDLERAARDQWRECKLCPVLTGSALRGLGIRELLDFLSEFAPCAGGDAQGPAAGAVFKVEQNEALGRVAYVRLYSGTLKNRDLVKNATQGTEHKVVQIRKTTGRHVRDVGELKAGDIGAVCGLGPVRAGDLLGEESLVPGGVTLASALLRVRLVPRDEGDYPRLAAACEELCAEDPLLNYLWDAETRQLLVHLTGLIQLEILESQLRDRFGLQVDSTPPEVIYRETPTRRAVGYDEYTMPKPCWAILKFVIEPLPPGSGVVYECVTPDTRIPYRYQGQVAQTIPLALQQGPKGWEVTDVKITLVDGSAHHVHTHPLDFATATPMALMKGLVAAETRLLEPIQRFRLTAPEECGGKLMGEIINMRGTLEDSRVEDGKMTLTGVVPAGEALDFPAFVAGHTGGRGILQLTFDSYRPCPSGVGKTAQYRGINPLDRDKYILHVRGAL